ncbi:hypothetical protein GCM10022221_19560 [Actinocorallia aurea]
MVQHHGAVRAEPDVELDGVDPERERVGEGRKGVFGTKAASTAMPLEFDTSVHTAKITHSNVTPPDRAGCRWKNNSWPA